MGRSRTPGRRTAAAAFALLVALVAPAPTLAGQADADTPGPACPEAEAGALGAPGCTSPPPKWTPPKGTPPKGTPPKGTPPKGTPPKGTPPKGTPPKDDTPPVTTTPPPAPAPPAPAVLTPAPVAPPPAVPVAVAAAPAAPAPKPRLRVVKTGPTTVRAGTVASFRVRVVNRGRGVARRVRIVDLLPSGFSLVRRSSTPGTLVRGRPTWRIGRLRPGAARVVRVVLRADRDVRGGRCNRAEARAPGSSTARDRFCFRIRALAPARVIPRVTG